MAADVAADMAADSVASGVASSVDLRALLSDFVAAHAGMRQRDAGWYSSMGTTVGGSELAAIMGTNPYSKLRDVVYSKVGTLTGGGSGWTGGSESTWWGTLFEDVIGAYVEADLGGPILGDEICIRAVTGHRNSPDGYIVASLALAPPDADTLFQLWTTDMAPEEKVAEVIVLLEFKCPYSRLPCGKVPKQYLPQVWSGLAVSPVAHLGLFVDAVFRKCSMLDLGDSPDYDREYHAKPAGRKKKEAPDTVAKTPGPPEEAEAAEEAEAGEEPTPVAWGLIGVYAPTLTAPRHLRMGWRGEEWAAGDPSPDAPDADASLAALQIYAACNGMKPGPAVGKAKDTAGFPEVADLGDAPKKVFDRALALIGSGRFRVERLFPCFADGRGLDLRSGAGVRHAVTVLVRGAPAHCWLVGVFPWKLFEVLYVPVDRRAGFLEEIAPLIEDVHSTVQAAIDSGDPTKFLSKRFAPPAGTSNVGADAIQDLFDAIAADAAAATGLVAAASPGTGSSPAPV